MKKILVFALICTMILGAAMAETMTETTAMPCMMNENMSCRMNRGCMMAQGETTCPMMAEGEEECAKETCPYMVDGVCTLPEGEACPCENCGIATTEEPVYLLPESDVRLIEKEELKDVDKETLALMRNEILARHGYPFQKAEYQEYFGSQSWYTENPDFDYNMLSKIEMNNVETIKKLEEAK